MDNQQCSHIFEEIASLLAIQGDDPYRIRAYRRAAQSISYLSESLSHIARRDALEDIAGIGKTLSREIQELLETGHLRYHEQLKTTVPAGLLPFLHFPSLSAEQVRTLWRQHQVTSLQQLAHLLEAGTPSFDAPTLAALERDMAAWQRDQHRMLLGVALPRAELLIQNLAQLPLVQQVSIAGSIRRGLAMVGDINIVMASPDPPRLIHLCNQQPEVRQVVATEPTSTVVLTSEGLRVSLVATLQPHFASTLHHYTGVTAHLAALRRIAHLRGWRLTEHGFVEEHGTLVPMTDEADIYRLLDLPYIAPELREDRGEIEAAETGSLPTLVNQADIIGDLHVYSDWGDGAHSLEMIAHAAQRMGYQYVAICDRAYVSATGRGLTPDVLAKQIAAIRAFNARRPKNFRLLAGIEVDITADGMLEADETLLQECDLVIAAAHTGMKEPRQTLTRRLCKALEHPYVDILAHPTGRRLGVSEQPTVDIAALIDTAVETRTCLEINTHVLRLDLPDTHVRHAAERGVTLALGSGAYHVREMRTLSLGVHTARRGWAAPDQCLNTLPHRKLLQRLRKRKASHVA